MTNNNELIEKVQKTISLYAEKMMVSGRKDAVEQLRNHSELPCGVGCYIDSNNVSDAGIYDGGYAILKYAGIQYNPKTNNLEVDYPQDQIPMGIDLMAWVLEIEDKLNGTIDVNVEPKQEAFYLGNVSMTKLVSTKEYIQDPAIKTKADILDTLLRRSEVVIKK